MEAAKTQAAYRIDPKPSRLAVQVTAGGFLTSFGHNPTIAARNFTGEALSARPTTELSSSPSPAAPSR